MTATDDDFQDAEPAETSTSEALEAVKQKLNRATGNLLEFLLDLMKGKYTESLREPVKASEKISKAVAATLNPDTPSSNELVKAVSVVVQSFDTSSISVSVTGSVPAPSLLTASATLAWQSTPALLTTLIGFRGSQAM